MPFKTFETEDDYNADVRERINTAENAVKDSFKGYLSPAEVQKLNDKITAHETKITELTVKNQAYEKTAMKQKIAREKGIPYELAERLSGNDEKELSADADNFMKYMNPSIQPTPDFHSNDTKTSGSDSDSAYMEMLSDLNI